jgi:hypothetical protein
MQNNKSYSRNQYWIRRHLDWLLIPLASIFFVIGVKFENPIGYILFAITAGAGIYNDYKQSKTQKQEEFNPQEFCGRGDGGSDIIGIAGAWLFLLPMFTVGIWLYIDAFIIFLKRI